MLSQDDINRRLAELDMREKSILGGGSLPQNTERQGNMGSMPMDNSSNGGDVAARLKALDERESQILGGSQQPKEYSYLDRAAQGVRGIGSGATGLVDLAKMANSAVGLQNKDWFNKHNKERGLPELEQKPYDPLTPKFKGAFDKVYGKDLTPTDTTGEIIQGAGEFFSPIPGTGWAKAAKAGIAPLAKLAGKEATKAAGASGLIHGTTGIGDEGSVTRGVTDFGKAIVGSKVGANPLKTSKGLLSSLLHPIETSKNLLAKGASKFIKPDKEFLESAKKHEIDVPFNVGANSKTANFTANNWLKSMFTSKKYKDSLEKADASVVGAVKRSIDSLGDANLKPNEASAEYRNFLKTEEKQVKAQSDKLYDIARKSLKDTDGVMPSHTLKSLNSEPVKELLDTISPSSAQKKVIERIKEIQEGLSSSNELPKSFLQRYEGNSKFKDAVAAKFKGSDTTDVGKLISLRSSLMQTLKYDHDIRGAEGFLSRIVKDLDKDISSVKNPEFLAKYRGANAFFKQNIADRFRESLAKGVMSNKAPQEAFNLMNSVDNVNLLGKIAGETPQGKDIFNSLKKAKAKQMLESAIQGDFDNGSIRGNALSKIFQKGEKRQELLEALLGKKEYNNLAEIAKISEQFAKDGRELLNTSGTAHVLSDMNAAKNIAAEVSKTMAYMFGSAGAGYKAGGLPGAIGAVGAPYVVSRLLADEKFVNLARQYALARQAKNEKLATTLLNKMVPMAQLAVKTQMSQSKKKEDKK